MGLIKFYNRVNDLNPMIDRSFRFESVLDELIDSIRKDDDKMKWMPAVNITENNDAYRIDISVPGIEKNDLKIEVEEGILYVSGERKEMKKTENETMRLREIHHGFFKRSFTLPDHADSETISAEINNGILSLTVNKKPELKMSAKREITIA